VSCLKKFPFLAIEVSLIKQKGPWQKNSKTEQVNSNITNNKIYKEI